MTRTSILFNQEQVPFIYVWNGKGTVKVARTWGPQYGPDEYQFIEFDVFTFMDAPATWGEALERIFQRHMEYTTTRDIDDRYIRAYLGDKDDSGRVMR